jgi:hypothetical protein
MADALREPKQFYDDDLSLMESDKATAAIASLVR